MLLEQAYNAASRAYTKGNPNIPMLVTNENIRNLDKNALTTTFIDDMMACSNDTK